MSHYTEVDSSDDMESSLNLNLNLSDDDLVIRKRRPWNPEIDSLGSGELDILDDDDDALYEEEDGGGCPLPSTPEDNQLLEAEVIYYYLFRNKILEIFHQPYLP